MTQQQLIALFEERQRLSTNPINISSYELVLTWLKSQVLYTQKEVETLCRSAYEAGCDNTVMNDLRAPAFTEEEYQASELENWLKANLTKSV